MKILQIFRGLFLLGVIVCFFTEKETIGLYCWIAAGLLSGIIFYFQYKKRKLALK